MALVHFLSSETMDEDFETFSNVLRNRSYNSGYREGLFEGKRQVIQDAFDKGYQLGARLAALKVLEKSFIKSEKVLVNGDDLKDENVQILEDEIERIKSRLVDQIPEIKIASNIFIGTETQVSPSQDAS